MKVGVYGLDADWGLPVALALRHYGRHSVVGWDPFGHFRQGRLHKLDQDLWEAGEIPVAPTAQVFRREAADLVLVCVTNGWAEQVAGVVYPTGARILWTSPMRDDVFPYVDNYRFRAGLEPAPHQGMMPLWRGRPGCSVADAVASMRSRWLVLPELPDEDMVRRFTDLWTPLANTTPYRVFTTRGADWEQWRREACDDRPPLVSPGFGDPSAGVDNPPGSGGQRKGSETHA